MAEPGLFEGAVGPGITLPVPPETVALLRMPIPLGSLGPIVTGLKGTYGEGLVIRTDAGIEGWLVIARPADAPVVSPREGTQQ